MLIHWYLQTDITSFVLKLRTMYLMRNQCPFSAFERNIFCFSVAFQTKNTPENTFIHTIYIFHKQQNTYISKLKLTILLMTIDKTTNNIHRNKS